MDDYNLIAPFYDLEHAHFDEDLDLYRGFAELCGRTNPILELACGSGRLLLPLAQAGYTVTGVDISTEMLSLATQCIQQNSVTQHCTLVQQDMRCMHLEQTFRLAFIALGSFGHLTSRRDQQQTLAAVRAHLRPGGTFIVDISNADVRYMEHMSGQLLHQGTWKREDGILLTHFVSPISSATTHLLELTHFYDQYSQGGGVQRSCITTSLYLFDRSEMELLFEQAGFIVKDVYGDYNLNPYELDSKRMIFICEAL